MEIVVFTNGCFDLIHPGHIDLLKKARALGTKLIVGLNSDRSVRAIKGSTRPFLKEEARAAILRELRSVDEVRIFEENTPEKLIREIRPDVLVKGGDWSVDQIVGANFVLKNGGKVYSIPFVENFSTSKIADKIKFSEAREPESREKAENGLFIESFLNDQISVFENLLKHQAADLARCGEILRATLKSGNKVFLCGESQDLESLQYFSRAFAEKLTEYKFQFELIMAAPKDAEELAIAARPGDLLLCLAAGGEGPNNLSTIMKARETGCRVISLTRTGNVKIASLSDSAVVIAEKKPEIVGPAHRAIGELWCEILKNKTND